LLDLGVHLFDVARFVLGDELEVVAAEVNHDGGIDVDAAVSLRSTRGVAVQVEVSWRSPAPGFELSLADDAGVVECRPNLGVPADTVQAAFVRAVTSGASYSPTAADGRAAVALAHDAYAAAR
jgi:predicted dehydrogenase